MDDYPYENKILTPARKATAITPNDSTTFFATKAVYVGSGGDIAVQFVDGNDTVLFKNVAEGMILPIRVRKVLATGTTAASLLAFY